MANEKNLISLSDRPKEERQEIARLGGVKSGEVRKQKARFKHALNSMLVQGDFKNAIQGYHFRNGKITDKQVQETRSYLKSMYHLRLQEQKREGATEEEIQQTKEAYQLLRRRTKTFLKELAQEKQEINNKLKQQDKNFNRIIKKGIRGRY